MAFLEPEDIRLDNFNRLLNEIMIHRTVTRKDLAQLTGLSLMTVSNLVTQLKKNGLLLIGDSSQPEIKVNGRRAEWISICTDKQTILILDLTRQHLHADLLGLDLQVICKVRSLQILKTMTEDDFRAALTIAWQQINNAKGNRDLIGIGVITAGPYQENLDRVINHRVELLRSISLRQILQEVFGTEIICIDEDVKHAVRASQWLIPGVRDQIFDYLYIGQGVGGAIMIEGRLLRGQNGFAGDAGQIRCQPASDQALNGLSQNHSSKGSPFFTYDQGLNFTGFYYYITRQPTPQVGEVSSEELTADIWRLKHEQKGQYKKGLMEYYDRLNDLLVSLIWLTDPHALLLESDFLQDFEPDCLQQIKTRLEQTLVDNFPQIPKIYLADKQTRHAYIGACIQVIDCWLSDGRKKRRNRP